MVDSCSYSPYGVQTINSQSFWQPYGYDGGLEPDGSSLIQFGARYYQPGTGTWTQPDPSGQSIGYGYADDDPLNGSDPTGLSAGSMGSGEYDSIAQAEAVVERMDAYCGAHRNGSFRGVSREARPCHSANGGEWMRTGAQRSTCVPPRQRSSQGHAGQQ